jgi:hypothetical protein
MYCSNTNKKSLAMQSGVKEGFGEIDDTEDEEGSCSSKGDCNL